MTKKWFKGKTVTVFGIGLLGGGIGTIRFLALHGANVIATDIKSQEELAPSLEKLKDLKNVTYILGRHRREDFSAVDMVVKTPSCPWTNEHVTLARANKIPVETDASLFFQLCRAVIIGVTGTKGKTTTSHMIDHILKQTRKNPLQIGIGTTSVLDRLSLVKHDTIVVFELSSWRLSALKYCERSPHIAVITNIFPDHLNYYKTMEAYFEDKKNIFLYQKPNDYLIYNADNKYLASIEDEITSRSIRVTGQRDTVGRTLFLEDGYVYINDGIDVKKMISVEDLPMSGRHNHLNALMSIGAVMALDIAPKKIIAALRTFKGVQHRMELIRTFSGVQYINDTAATAPDAAIASMTSYNQPMILIAGGADKKLPAQKFAEALLQYPKDVVFFKGEATDKILLEMKKSDALKVKEMNYAVVGSMKEAIDVARAKAAEGDIVLMSPGAASFGIFKNEFDRGLQFREAVENL